MDASGIKDEESLRAWLEGRPREDAILIAQRAALRVWPVWGAESIHYRGHTPEFTNILILRAILTSCVARVSPTPEVLEAAAAAASATARFADIFDAATPANHVAYAASACSEIAAGNMIGKERHFSAFATEQAIVAIAFKTAAVRYSTRRSGKTTSLPSVRVATNAFRTQIRIDAAMLASEQDASRVPIWKSKSPEHLVDLERRALVNLALETGSEDSFWHRWYLGAKSGEWLNWDLQKAVALLPEDVWAKAPGGIEQEISKIEAEFAAKANLSTIITATPNAETIERDDRGLFYVVPVTTIRPDLFRNAIEKVQDTVAEVRSAVRLANCRPFLSDDLARLDDHFARYGTQPLRIHDVFQKTLRHLDELRTEGVLPKDSLLDDLYQDLDTGAVDIRRADTEVAKTVKARLGDRIARIKPEAQALTATVVEGAAQESQPELRSELTEDLATAIDPKAEETDRDESSYRLVSRVARMAKRRKDDVVKTMDDAGKVARGAEAIGSGVRGAKSWWDMAAEILPSWFG